jgi:hypothetical protein
MKAMKLKKYICAVTASLVIAGCSLQEEPYGFLSTDNFYKTATDANAALVYAYAILPEIEYYSRVFIVNTEIPTENLTLKPDAGASNFEMDELRTRPDNPDIATTWRYGYIGANRANAVIAHVPKIQMDETTRNQIVGEAYFLRALHYFNLVRMFGEIPLRTDPVTSIDQVNLPKSSIQDVYNIIISDLTQAIDMMDLTVRPDRVNKVAAWSLLSKVYLHLASSKSSASPGYEFVSSADDMYANAKTYAGKVVNEQTDYGLDPDLLAIWDVDKEHGPEHIFAASTDRSGQTEGNYSKLPLMFIPYIGSGGPFFLPDGTQVISGFNHLITEPAIYNSYKDYDKRKTQLIASKVFVGASFNVATEDDLHITDYNRPFTLKYLDKHQAVGTQQTSTNTPILRYSDILLVYAEACGPTTEGYNAINQIRSRAGLLPLTPSLDMQTFRDSVLVERAWELAFEGNRLFDLRRTHNMEKVLEDQYGKTIQTGAYFFAIPQTEVDNNPYID